MSLSYYFVQKWKRRYLVAWRRVVSTWLAPEKFETAKGKKPWSIFHAANLDTTGRGPARLRPISKISHRESRSGPPKCQTCSLSQSLSNQNQMLHCMPFTFLAKGWKEHLCSCQPLFVEPLIRTAEAPCCKLWSDDNSPGRPEPAHTVGRYCESCGRTSAWFRTCPPTNVSDVTHWYKIRC